jgi:hypothetical protein
MSKCGLVMYLTNLSCIGTSDIPSQMRVFWNIYTILWSQLSGTPQLTKRYIQQDLSNEKLK